MKWLRVSQSIQTLRRGRRVRLSDVALENGLQGRAKSRYATLVSDSGGYAVTIRRDGLKSTESFAAHLVEYAVRQ